jgi:hypothetical protein
MEDVMMVRLGIDLVLVVKWLNCYVNGCVKVGIVEGMAGHVMGMLCCICDSLWKLEDRMERILGEEV